MKRRFFILLGFLFSSTIAFSQQSQFSAQVLFGPTGYIWGNNISTDVKADFNYSGGLYIQANIPVEENRITIRSGYFIDTKHYSDDLSNVSPYRLNKVEREFLYGNVPIMIGLQFNVKNKLYPFLYLGIVFGKVRSAEQTQYWNDGSISTGFTGKTMVLETPKDMYVGFGLDFRVTKYLFLRAEPFLSHQINGGSGYNIDDDGGISYGLKIGLSYDIFIPLLEK